MIKKGYSLERFCRVYDDINGCYYEIRPDSDGLDCVEVTYCDGSGLTSTRERCITANPDMAKLLAQAILEVAASITRGDAK